MGCAHPGWMVIIPTRRVSEGIAGPPHPAPQKKRILDRGVLPEVLTLSLHLKGNVESAGAAHLRSPVEWTELRISGGRSSSGSSGQTLLGGRGRRPDPLGTADQFTDPGGAVLPPLPRHHRRDAPPEKYGGLLVGPNSSGAVML